VFADVEYDAGLVIPRHQHANARFILVRSGSIVEVCDDEEASFGPSTLLFRRADEPHAYATFPRRAGCLIVDMDPAWLARVPAPAALLERSTAFRRGLLLHLAQRLYSEFRQRDEVSRLAIEGLVLGMLAEASRRALSVERPAPPWLRAAIAIVDQQFGQPLSLATVSKSVGVHPVHLARTFRRVYSTSFAAYVRQIRIDFAERQLVGAAALSDIAYAAGFCDQSHFSRCFKRHTGLTPAEYRARHR
jgi:AraC family transcriptional regulator